MSAERWCRIRDGDVLASSNVGTGVGGEVVGGVGNSR